MIAHLRGLLVSKTLDHVVIDVQGVGYQVFVPLSTYYTLPEGQERVSLLTTTYVREDTLRLYGFATPEERSLFDLLIGVASVGPRLALNMLSSMAAAELQQAIVYAETARLQAIPGIGRKTAERVVLELQEKVASLHIALATSGPKMTTTDEQVVNDVLSALQNLGYKRAEAEKAVQAVRAMQDGAVVLEPLLKDALHWLAR